MLNLREFTQACSAYLIAVVGSLAVALCPLSASPDRAAHPQPLPSVLSLASSNYEACEPDRRLHSLDRAGAISSGSNVGLMTAALAYRDDFDDPHSGWEARRTSAPDIDDMGVEYDSGRLITWSEDNYDFGIFSPMIEAPPPPYTITMETKLHDGVYVPAYGIVFRGETGDLCPVERASAKDANGCFYHYFRLNVAVNMWEEHIDYSVSRIDSHGDRGEAEGEDLSDGYHSIDDKANWDGWNTWEIEVHTEWFQISVNGERLGTYYDDTYSGDGHFGILTSNYEFAPAAFEHEYFYVESLGEEPTIDVEASFTASPTSGVAPLTVGFNNASTGDYNTCMWDFGDGDTDTSCGDPSHSYTAAGVYTPTLTISGSGSTDTLRRTNYITAYEPVRSDFNVTLPLVANDYSPPWPPKPISPDWLQYVNYYRQMALLPPVEENGDWNYGDWLHARYIVKNDVMQHFEDPKNPWYTEEGDAAAEASNLAARRIPDASDEWVIDAWMQAPFHALGIIDPQLWQVGYGSYREADGGYETGAALDVVRGLDDLAPSISFPLPWPSDAATVPLAEHWGEHPDPLTSCPGYSEPAGLPVILQIGRGNLTPSVTAHSFAQGGTPLDHCAFDETNYKNPNSSDQDAVRSILDARDAIVIVPRDPLTPGAEYTASVTVNGETHTWSFTVSSTASSVSAYDLDQLPRLGRAPVPADVGKEARSRREP